MLHNLFYAFLIQRKLLCIYISFNHYIFIFHILDAFSYQYNTNYAFKMRLRNRMQCDVSHFYKTCILSSIVESRKNLALVAWRYIKNFRCGKNFQHQYFLKNPVVNRYFQKKGIGISLFCNPVRLPHINGITCYQFTHFSL